MSEQQKQPKKLPPAGAFLATIIGGAIHTENGEVKIATQFQLKGVPQGEPNRIWWYGDIAGPRADYQFANGKIAKQYTFENLARLGLNENKVMNHPDASDSFRFDASYYLDPTKEVEVTIEHWAKDGKSGAQVKYINETGGGKFGKVAPTVVKSSLASANFMAEMMAARASIGAMPPQAEEKAAAPSFDSSESIPF